jgi:hypothetical protein
VVGFCECDNEPAVSVKLGKFLDLLTTGYILKNAVLHEYVEIFK